MAKNDKKILIIDGHALLYRAWHALPPLTTKDGKLVNALYGFASILFKAINEFNPEYIAVAFDSAEETFRKKAVESYKAHREKQPDELYTQIEMVQELLDLLDIPHFEMPGYEADDIIATMTRMKALADVQKLVLTGDLDLLQLVNDSTFVVTFKKGISEIMTYDEAAVHARYHLSPEHLIDFKALKGDPSDNIAGVAGIGAKTAEKLLQKYPTLEELYDALEQFPEDVPVSQKMQDKLTAGKKDAFASRDLVRVITDLPLDFSRDGAEFGVFDYDAVVEFLREYNFKSLVSKIPQVKGKTTVAEKKASVQTQYILVNTPELFALCIADLEKADIIAFDTETTSLNIWEATLLGISFSCKDAHAYYIDFSKAFSVATPQFKDIQRLLENPKILKVGHNVKYDTEIMKQLGISVQGVCADTLIAAYLLQPGQRSYGLKDITFYEIGYQMLSWQELATDGKKTLEPSDIPLEKLSVYSCEDADYTLRLWHIFEQRLRQEGLLDLFNTIEIPLIRVLQQMELTGISLDVPFLEKMSVEITGRITQLESTIYDAAGEEFNINSPTQLRDILFEKLAIPSYDIKSTKSGYSTAASELNKLKMLHPIVPVLIEYRELMKLKSTYVDALPLQVNAKTHRVHSKLNQTVTATGRLSSNDPNLQNIPTRTELGKKIRRSFVAQKGYSLISADYSQVELRIIASLSKDPIMIKAFEAGEDIHRLTASLINHVALEDVTKEMRSRAKEVNFGVIYGMGAYGLAERTGISRAEAKAFIDAYFENYVGMKAYIDATKKQAEEEGFVTTLTGRRRYLPDLTSGVPQLRAAAQRMAVNFPAQGTSADVIKIAMNNVYDSLSEYLSDDRVRLLLQVHDELVFEIKDTVLDEVLPIIRREMVAPEHDLKLKTPLIVDFAKGDNWGEMQKIVF